jgi:hypothetical protein
MSDILTCIVVAFAVYFILSLVLVKDAESFGTDNKPFEPDNSMVQNNPWDNINYIVPTFVI